MCEVNLDGLRTFDQWELLDCNGHGPCNLVCEVALSTPHKLYALSFSLSLAQIMSAPAVEAATVNLKHSRLSSRTIPTQQHLGRYPCLLECVGIYYTEVGGGLGLHFPTLVPYRWLVPKLEGYNTKGGSNGHFNHVDLRSAFLLSLYLS